MDLGVKFRGSINNIASAGLTYITGSDHSDWSAMDLITYFRDQIVSNTSINNFSEYIREKALNITKKTND